MTKKQCSEDTSVPNTCVEFCRSIIHGPSGMLEYEEREWIVYHENIRVHAAEWALRCLANPDCPGSAEAVAAILKHRKKLLQQPRSEDVTPP